MTIRPPTPKRLLRRRGGMPPGYLVGRLDGGIGDEQLISLQKLAQALNQTGAVMGEKEHPVLFFVAEGLFAANQRFYLAMPATTVTFPSATVPSIAIAGQAPLATTDLFLAKDADQFLFDGSTLLCTVTFSAGQTSGSINWNNPPIILSAGTPLWLICDSTADPLLAKVQLALIGD